MPIAKELNIGVHVHDLGATPLPLITNKGYKLRNVIHIRGPQLFNAEHLNNICHITGRSYMNKYVVVINDERNGWWPCAWTIDGFVSGMCEIKENSE